MLGELLGARYRVINVLGSGGFGHTYVAEDMQRPGNPRCVLKHLTFASNDTAMLVQVRRLFQAEAESLEQLGQHDQIPRLLAYFEENREFYLVQEFIDGRPLSEELALGQRLMEPQVVDLLMDVLGILIYVHDQGVIHRDIKPDNLIRRLCDRKLVLIDFGAVKTIGSALLEAGGDTSLMSVPIYTSGYGASEQCLGRPRCSSDIYSLGMVGIQALTGMRPSQLPHEFNTCEVIWRDQAEVSDALAAVLDKMIRYHVTERYATAAAALQDLQAASGRPLASLNTAVTVIPAEQTQAQARTQAQAQAQRNSQPHPLPLSPPGILQKMVSSKIGRPEAAAQTAATLVSPLGSAQLGLRRRDAPPSAGKGAIVGWKIVTGAGLVAVAAIALTRGGLLNNPLATTPNVSTEASIASPPSLADRISTGNHLLNIWQAHPVTKQDGIEYLAAGNYAQAVSALAAARQADLSDPETLIYLNNARIGTDKSYQVAIAVPLGANVVQALELLRGVAQVQDTVNGGGGINGVKLKIAIVDDNNTPAIAQQLATSLANDASILAVIGHSNSDTSMAAAQVYKDRQLVMISPTSSAVKLSNFDRYIFRTVPSDRMTAQALGNYMLQRLKKRKAAVFFNAASEYSQSLKQEFKEALFYNNVELVQEVDLTRPDFDADMAMQTAIAQGVEVLMLAPDSKALDRAFQIIQLNRRRLQVLAGDTAYNPTLLKLVGDQAVGMVVAVPATVQFSPFQQQFGQLWGGKVVPSWRSALAYDSTQALVAALRKNPTRQGLQRTLALPTFTAPGAKGSVSFLGSGDRKGNVQLMTVVPTPTKPNGSPTYNFRTLP